MKKTIIYIIFALSGIMGVYSQPDITSQLGTIKGDYTFKIERSTTNAASTYGIGFYIDKSFIITAKESTKNSYFAFDSYWIGNTKYTGVNLDTSYSFSAGRYLLFFTNGDTHNSAFNLEITFTCESCDNETTEETLPANSPKNVIPNGANYIKTIIPLTGKDVLTGNTDTEMVSIQYFDGLGRPVETVQQKITPNKKDLVVLQDYDEFGRETYSWLPTPTNNTNGVFVTGSSVATLAKAAYNNDENPYSKPAYEISPLNRIKEQHGPGQVWQSKPWISLKTEYLTNTTTDPCRNYSISGDNLVKNAADYADGSLYVVRTIDEDNKISFEFRNQLGQVILQRQIDMGQKHDTYYVYDDYGNLRWILPPMIESITNLSESCKLYGYYYKYDNRNRCIEKKLPGADPIFYVYDKADRVIFSQDGEQRLTSSWTFFKYDALDRMILTGVWKNSEKSQANLVDSFGNTLATETFSNASAYNYTWNTLTGTQGSMVIQANYYDNYDFRTNTTGLNNSNYTYSTPSGYVSQRYGTDTDIVKSKGLQTGSITVMLDDPNKKMGAVFYYDYRNRMIQSIAANHLSGYEKEYIEYTFTGQPKKIQKVHKTFGSQITEIYEYSYDHANRPTTTLYQLDANPSFVISSLSYDEIGRVKEKKLHGNKETITYTYNIRNWLSKIHSANFIESLYYTERYLNVTPLYNGNIAVTESSSRSYAYTYDGLNRMTKATSYTYGTQQKHFDEELTYDKQGNILSLKRNEQVGSSYQTEQLYMNYTGNQLTGINPRQGVSSTMTKNTYNKNGALISDLTRNISQIEYNTLNLPEKITFGEDAPFVQMGVNSNKQHTTEYSYDATGVKRRVIHTTIDNMTVVKLTMANDMESFSLSDPEPSAPSGFSSDPSDPLTSLISKEEKEGNFVGISRTITDYCGNIVYENGNLKYILNPEGYITKDKNTPVYHYYLKDHLGNNRVVMQLKGNNYTAVQKMDYYPFGKPFPDDANFNPEKQPYKFGNKELDEMHGLNQYDFEARQLRLNVPIFDRLDPHAEDYPWMSPYCAFANNPIRFIDPDGREVVIAGNSAQQIADELQKQSKLTLSYDANNSYLSYTKEDGVEYSKFDQELMAAIDDSGVQVKLNGVSVDNSYSHTTADRAQENKSLVFGSFEGSVVRGSGDNTKVFATQSIDITTSINAEKAGGDPAGKTVGHELLEGYYGAKDSPGAKSTDRKAYMSSHNKSLDALPLKMSKTILYDNGMIKASPTGLAPVMVRPANPRYVAPKPMLLPKVR
ncbi:MAG: DUF6443 domain-containing protein [Dysgonamonadaceae bacterium]|jgi:RHS repeat-associated protein|nr:DUF6443 domain-containing protein [Dysgonamonadaceae bacterium]